MSVKRPSKPSGEHPAVQAFRAKLESINETTMPLLARLEERVDRAMSTPPKTLAGEWTIVIKGLGPEPTEAARLTAALIRELRAFGHVVTGATVSHGSTVQPVEDTTPPPPTDLEPDDEK